MKRVGKATARRRTVGRAYIGTSGYVYKHWANGVFYPEKLPGSKWLHFYTQHFSSVELNGTFYKLPGAHVFQNWYEQSPRGFSFFVKGSRFVTHFKHLKDPQQPLERFFGSVHPLKEKLAGVLWQLPGQYKVNVGRVAEFLKAFRQFSDTRVVMEFRNPTWFIPETTAVLKEFDAVYCRADAPEFYLGLSIPHTANYAYYRRHGAGAPTMYSGNYPDESLAKDAAGLRDLISRGMDVFCYFNNDIGGHAPRNAATLEEYLLRGTRGGLSGSNVSRMGVDQ